MSLLGTTFGNGASPSSITSIDPALAQAIQTASGLRSAYHNAMRKELMHGLFPDSVGKTIFDGRLIVTKVLNGYVVQYVTSSGVQPDVYVEVDLDGVNARIKALMTSFNLESK
jgi:hypothetical protein